MDNKTPIVLIDTNKARLKAIYEAFRVILKEEKLSESIEVYYSHHSNNFHIGPWVDWRPTSIKIPNKAALIFQHQRDAVDIESNLNVHYTGRSSGIDSSLDFFGVKEALTRDNIVEVFSKAGSRDFTYLKEILFFALGKGTLPSILNVKPSDDVLEEQLIKKYEAIDNTRLKKNIDLVFSNISYPNIEKIKVSKFLLFWPGISDMVLEKLVSKLGLLFEIDSSGVQYVETKNQLEAFESFDGFDLVIINTDYAFKNEKLSNFSGATALEILRRKKYKGISLLFTLLPDYLKSKTKEPAYKILSTNFNFIFDLSSQADQNRNNREINNLLKLLELGEHKMSNLNLNDIRDHILRRKGQLRDIFHDLREYLEKREKNIDRILKNAFEEIKFLIPGRNLPYFEKIQSNFFSCFLELDKSEIIKTLDNLKDQIRELIPEEISDSKPLKHDKSDAWEVLILDDNPKFSEEISNLLLNEKDIKSQVFDSVASAIRGINQNNQKFRVAIIDIRLKKGDGTGRWQILQGYDFINYVTKKGLYLSFLVLTRKEQFFLDQAKRKFPLRLSWFTKEELKTKEGVDKFMKTIIEGGTEPIFIPIENAWVKFNKKIRLYPLEVYYVKYYQDSRYFEWEEWINRKVDNFIKRSIETNPYEAIKGIRPPKLSSGLKEYEFKGENIDFRNKLLARRLMIAACFFYTKIYNGEEKVFNKSGEIYELLMGQPTDHYNWLFRDLGISAPDGLNLSEENLLIEERKYAKRIIIRAPSKSEA